jgi:hypothetical protein
MLKSAAEFPYPGSFALLVDDTLPVGQQRAEMVRLLEVGCQVALVAFPLRLGARGNRRVALAELKDGTALTKGEERELADLQRHLHGRDRLTSKMREQAKRAETLRERAIWSVVMASERDRLGAIEARSQPSAGRAIPREIAA